MARNLATVSSLNLLVRTSFVRLTNNFLSSHVAEEAFADVYKVEGLHGIYIASQVTYPFLSYNIGPQHLVTKITFDHGANWGLITAPERDQEGQLISCSLQNNCSLHLTQRFSQLYPDTRTVSILSSKSAPGIIIATGVLGKSLKVCLND